MYKYYLLLRPVDIGTVTKGFINFKNYDDKKYIKDTYIKAWGEVYYDEKLSSEEISGYDLKAEPTEEDKKRVMQDIAKLEEIKQEMLYLEISDENVLIEMQKISTLVDKQIDKILSNNLISHKEYDDLIQQMKDDEEETEEM